jgi:hypothetical protein
VLVARSGDAVLAQEVVDVHGRVKEGVDRPQ